MSTESFPKVPISFKSLKLQIRQGLSQDARLYWWPCLPKIIKGENIVSYPNVQQMAEKRYNFINKMSMTELNEVGPDDLRPAADKILHHLMEQFPMDEPALIKPLVLLILTVVSKKDICFSICCDILEKPIWFITPSAVSHRSKLYVFRKLVHKQLPSMAKKLEPIDALHETHLNSFFIEFFSNILPLAYVVRILDSYLLEGNKVLYRFGLALLHLLKRRVKADEFHSSEAFWTALTAKGKALTEAEYVHMAYYAFMTPTRFSRSQLTTLEGKGVSTLGPEGKAPLGLPCISAVEVQTDNCSEALHGVSTILNTDSAARLRDFLPANVRFEDFTLAFSTATDGWTLDTLYRLCEYLAPVILLVKLLEVDAVIGAYLAAPIAPPSPHVRGDGTTRCFRLDGPRPTCYEWSPDLEDGTAGTREQFAVCANTHVSFGASALHAANALRVDADLKHCECSPSDTFGNKFSLVPEPHQSQSQLSSSSPSQSQYTISVLEVLVGTVSMQRRDSD
eukprot:gene38318-50294_t